MRTAIHEFQLFLINKGYDLGPARDDGDPGPKTKYAAEAWAKEEHNRKGYSWYPSNIVPVRMSAEFTDRFSDVALIVNKGKVVEVIIFTTKAGNYYVKNPLTVGGITGTGIIKEGQHVNSHQFTTTANKYGCPYFNQVKSIPVYRDGNKDNKVDKNIVQVAPSWYAFLIHQMGAGFNIWNWSAGCLGTPKAIWLSKVCPYFTPWQIISPTILEA